jgi:hypothetical protein
MSRASRNDSSERKLNLPLITAATKEREREREREQAGLFINFINDAWQVK